MSSAVTAFLSPVSSQTDFHVQASSQQGAQARRHFKTVEIIASHVEEIIEQSLLIKISSEDILELKEVTENILRYVTYALFLENSSVLANYLTVFTKAYFNRKSFIHSITQVIPLMKSASIECVKKNFSGDCHSLLAEIGTYFDFVASALYLHEAPSDQVLELMTELKLRENSNKRVENLLERLSDLLDHSKQYVQLWLTSPHPDFGGKTPIFYLQQNKIEVVENLVEAIETGQIG